MLFGLAAGTLMTSLLLSVASVGSAYEAVSTVPAGRALKGADNAASKMPELAAVWVRVTLIPLTLAVKVFPALAAASSKSITRSLAVSPTA